MLSFMYESQVLVTPIVSPSSWTLNAADNSAVGHNLASAIQQCKSKLTRSNTVTNTTIATVRQIDCVDITEMSRDEIFDMCGVLSREEAGEKVMLQVLDLLEYGRSQTLDRDHLQVIKSFVDEMLGC